MKKVTDEALLWFSNTSKVKQWIRAIKGQKNGRFYIVYSINSDFKNDETVESLGLCTLGRRIEVETNKGKQVIRTKKVEDNIQSCMIQVYNDYKFYMMKTQKDLVFSIHIDSQAKEEALLYILSLLKCSMVKQVTLLAGTTGKQQDTCAINKLLSRKEKDKKEVINMKSCNLHLIKFGQTNGLTQTQRKKFSQTSIDELLQFFREKKLAFKKMTQIKDKIILNQNTLLRIGRQVVVESPMGNSSLEFKQFQEIEKKLQIKRGQKTQKPCFLHLHQRVNFVIQICEIQNEFRERLKKKQKQLSSIELLKDYLSRIRDEFINFFPQQKSSIFEYVTEKTNQLMQIVDNINPNIVSKQFQLLLNQIVPLNFDTAQILKNLYLKMVMIENNKIEQYKVEKNQPPEYYVSLGKVFKFLHDRHQNFVHPNKRLINEAYLKTLSRIKIYRLLSILDQYQASLKPTQFEEISQFFENYKSTDKYEQDVLLAIFAKIAKILKFYGYSQIAIQLFKKLRFENNIKSCAQQIAFMKESSVERGKFYLQIAQYYMKLNKKEKYIQYCQLAYEEDHYHLSALLKAQNNIELQKTYAKQIKEFVQKRQRYYSYELPKATIERLKLLKNEDFSNQTAEPMSIISEIPFKELPQSMKAFYS